jgi:PPM family protein phosphatase
MESIRINGTTNPGLVRTANQDACIVQPLWTADKALAAVIDGVGGYAGGEKAAAIAKACIEQYMQAPSGDTLTMLREALIFANNQVVAGRASAQKLREMCCVLTAVVADAAAQQLYYVHVGDTRLYRYRKGQLQKLTRDHSFAGIQEDAGEISEKEAMAHPLRNRILREIGSAVHRLDDEDFMDFGSESFVPGDIILLCSDGLTDMITAQQIRNTLSAAQPLSSATSQLIELANAAGGHDNITVVLLQYPVPPSTKKTDPALLSDQAALQSLPSEKPRRGTLQSIKPFIVAALLLLLLTAVAGWYITAPGKAAAAGATGILQKKDSVRTDSIQLKNTGRSSHPAVQGPVWQPATDTLYITATQDFAVIRKYTDSTGNGLVLLPAGNSRGRFSAISVSGNAAAKGDTVHINNLRLCGFSNGIDLHLPVHVATQNLVFENVDHPFRYLFTTGKANNTVLLINTAKQ